MTALLWGGLWGRIDHSWRDLIERWVNAWIRGLIMNKYMLGSLRNDRQVWRVKGTFGPS